MDDINSFISDSLRDEYTAAGAMRFCGRESVTEPPTIGEIKDIVHRMIDTQKDFTRPTEMRARVIPNPLLPNDWKHVVIDDIEFNGFIQIDADGQVIRAIRIQDLGYPEFKL